jgi:hypothetical protein
MLFKDNRFLKIECIYQFGEHCQADSVIKMKNSLSYIFNYEVTVWHNSITFFNKCSCINAIRTSITKFLLAS